MVKAQQSQNKDGLYIVLVSVHGLIRAHDLELGRDADTGGQTLYVVELARALAAHPEVMRVDLLTRRVIDQKISADYARPIEPLSANANLVRLECGPRRYLRKEALWSHLEGFIDKGLQHVRNVGRVPDIVHSHYADAGYVGCRLAGLLGIPLVHTGHSLGREKLKQLLNKGMKQENIEKQYNISTRIEAEEITLGTADMVVASTHQEVAQQYAEYDNYQPKRMVVIPPGVDLSRFHRPNGHEQSSPIAAEIARFLQQPKKPFILALSRADERKNISSLIHAYGQSPQLQRLANLVVVAGNRDDIPTMERGPRTVLTELLLLIDKYNLYGKVAYPKQHQADDVPVLYRLATKQKGVFINPALTEPFGLTLIEAAASGLPIVATHDGGPREIIKYCNNGALIDPLDIEDIKAKLLDTLSDRRRLTRWSKNGVQGAYRHFSWQGHAQTYITAIRKIITQQTSMHHTPAAKSRLPTVDRLAVSSLDNALVGDEKSLQDLLELLRRDGRHLGYAVATQRHLKSTLNILKKMQLPLPDVLITANGTEIHYCHPDKRIVEDYLWQKHIDYRWENDALLAVLSGIPGLTLRPKTVQGEHKLSFSYNDKLAPLPREIKKIMRRHDLHAKIILTEGKYLDLLPIRASKGLAIRYIALKWGLALERTLVVGDAGNDEEMLLGDTLGVVVGNHSQELDKLRGAPRIYFAQGDYAQGIIEGLQHYRFLGDIKIPQDADEESLHEEIA